MNNFRSGFDLSLHLPLQEIAAPLLKKLGCNYFQYLKVFADGSFSYNSTIPSWTAFTIDYLKKVNMPAVYSHIDGLTLDKNKYTFLWEPNLPKEPVRLAHEFDIANGITFVERHQDYYYMFGFGSSSTNYHALDNYFNNLNEMNQFIQEFKYNHKKLIKTLDAGRLSVAKERQDANLHKMLLPKKQKWLNDAKAYLTPQELTCLRAAALGLSYKEIAKKLSLSPRTVETYFNRMKQRLNVNHKKDLIQFLQNFCP